MYPTFELAPVIEKLVRIRDAGWWPDLENAICEATRGPARDLERWPDRQFEVKQMARFVARLTGVPEAICHEAACQRLLPSTRLSVALDIISEFDARLAEQEQAAAATAKIARERAGRRTA
ncbi:MAG: hypothetical protein JNL18_10300 [Planctomycetaceae bacterium]|nr:hypothetical protein [Planctomycetaceae bacterium]